MSFRKYVLKIKLPFKASVMDGFKILSHNLIQEEGYVYKHVQNLVTSRLVCNTKR